eukprot:1161354-Pelagomonas_calceolata.AAC.2
MGAGTECAGLLNPEMGNPCLQICPCRTPCSSYREHGFTLVNLQPESLADQLLAKHSQPAFTRLTTRKLVTGYRAPCSLR